MAEFTYLWTNRCRLNMLNGDCEGKSATIAAGNVFSKRGVRPGDLVYFVTVHQAKVHLIGRVRVQRIWQRAEWDAQHNTPNLWEGQEVIEGEDGTPMRFEFTMPPGVLERLRFTDGKERTKALAVVNGELAEPQSLRSVRRLTPAAARDLDALLT
jgi:hypothetical protein